MENWSEIHESSDEKTPFFHHLFDTPEKSPVQSTEKKATVPEAKVLGRGSMSMAAGIAVVILWSSFAAKFFLPTGEDEKFISYLDYIWIVSTDLPIFICICVIYGETWLMVLKVTKEVKERLDRLQRCFTVVAVNSLMCAIGIVTLHGMTWRFSVVSALTVLGIIIACLPIPIVAIIWCTGDASFVCCCCCGCCGTVDEEEERTVKEEEERTVDEEDDSIV